MRRLALASVLLLCVGAAGSGVATRAGGGSEPARAASLGDPGAFVKRLIVQVVRDDYARAWLTLHPAHKTVAPRWAYVDCELQTPVPGDIVSVKIVHVAGTHTLIAGVGRVPMRAVTFRLVLRQPALDETVTVTHTSHVAVVGGHWRWILTPERYELYRTGACAGPAPSA